MDTRFWGPSGWRLLHLVTFDYTYNAETAYSYAKFLETIPYILPCKFCRASLTDYYRQHPFMLSNSMLDPLLDLKKWMYTIHNCVNNKLRSQGLYATKNPTYKEVTNTYTHLLQCPWEQQMTLLWDFLFSVAYNHPRDTKDITKPMPECPKAVYTCKDNCEKNKWNVLPLKQRLYWYKRFWLHLPAVLPHRIREKWRIHVTSDTQPLYNRKTLMAWLWKIRCALDSRFHDPYTQICKKIGAYSSDCSKGKTCRKQRKRRTQFSKRKTYRKNK
jgi:hypothetical protein